MVAYQHPSELNPLQLYRQASSILRGTSRARNDGWYQSPLSLDFQVHLRFDGTHFESWIHHSQAATWTPGPSVSDELLLEPTKVPALADELIKLARKHGARAVGVILHVADEFATTEINPELDNPGALEDLRDAIVTDPGSVLDDSSLSPSEHSWRLVPYPAAGAESIATAITLTRHLGPFVDALREHGITKNFPITTLALSAPLIALLSIPEIKTSALEKPLLAVLPYPSFTVLAFFNPHGDLQLIRTLQHRGHRRPSNLRHAAATTAAALEMAAPEILVLPLNGSYDIQLASDLRIVFEASEIQEVDWARTPFHEAGEVSPEILISTRLNQQIDTPLAGSHTFTTMRAEGWAMQDFLPVPPEVSQIYPSRQDMKFLQAARHMRLGLAIVALLALIWSVFGILEMVRRPEWTFNDAEAQSVATRLNALGAEQSRIHHWENLLDDRSKGWASMELLSRLFTEQSGFLVKTFSHTAKPENIPGQTEAGFIKEWRLNGMAREEALERLADLNTREGISSVFSEVARVTGNQAFRVDLPTRSIVVNVKTLENNGFKPVPPEARLPEDETTYPFLFDLTITQRFESADPMALKTSKAP